MDHASTGSWVIMWNIQEVCILIVCLGPWSMQSTSAEFVEASQATQPHKVIALLSKPDTYNILM